MYFNYILRERLMFAFSRCPKPVVFFARCAALVLAIAASAHAEPIPAQIHPKAQQLIDGLEALRNAQDHLENLNLKKSYGPNSNT